MKNVLNLLFEVAVFCGVFYLTVLGIRFLGGSDILAGAIGMIIAARFVRFTL